MNRSIAISLALLSMSPAISLWARDDAPFRFTNPSRYELEAVIVSDKVTEPKRIVSKGGTLELETIPQALYILPKMAGANWAKFSFNPSPGNIAHVTVGRIRGGKVVLAPIKGVANNISSAAIKETANVSKIMIDYDLLKVQIAKPELPIAPGMPAPGTVLPAPGEPGKSCADIPKNEWIAIGIKNGWITAGGQLPEGAPEDMEKVLDKEALERLLKKVRAAKISSDKLPMVEEAITLFWNDAGRGQKTSLNLYPAYIFEALQQGDDTAKVTRMLGLWMGMPETARHAWIGETPEKIGKFLEERVRILSEMQIPTTPTKPETPEGVKPAPTPKDTRPLEEKASEWDEAKLNMEIAKRRFALSGPFMEKDPAKRAVLEKEADFLEELLDKMQK